MAKSQADTPESRAAKLAILKAGIEDADKRKKAETAQRKRVGDARSLRQTGRDTIFTFRSHPAMHDACKAAAAARGVKLAEWMEQALVAALESEGRDVAFLSDLGGRS